MTDPARRFPAWTAPPEQSWQAHRGAVTALAISNDTRLLATSGDTTLKLWLTEKAAGAARVVRIADHADS